MNKENTEICSAINIFSEWMGKRMQHKASDGFVGWQNPQNFNIRERLLIKAAKIATADVIEDKDLVDISNFAMMLFMHEWRKTFPFDYENCVQTREG